ncbi:hypothetical protein L798_15501 [Zootermopsis nevadensis]|uniref:Uncharacterized protein n=1 Tax=Zootermopsis nevadensis TaxID=136037 RepID=A0A067QM71_ZOONE|nr:hypothetical protein L798_15501 [Zootermopsis nevadensis]
MTQSYQPGSPAVSVGMLGQVGQPPPPPALPWCDVRNQTPSGGAAQSDAVPARSLRLSAARLEHRNLWFVWMFRIDFITSQQWTQPLTSFSLHGTTWHSPLRLPHVLVS